MHFKKGLLLVVPFSCRLLEEFRKEPTIVKVGLGLAGYFCPFLAKSKYPTSD